MPKSKYRISFGVKISVDDTVDNTVEGIFSGVRQFYIYEHLNKFSKYFIFIQYAYK